MSACCHVGIETTISHTTIIYDHDGKGPLHRSTVSSLVFAPSSSAGATEVCTRTCMFRAFTCAYHCAKLGILACIRTSSILITRLVSRRRLQGLGARRVRRCASANSGYKLFSRPGNRCSLPRANRHTGCRAGGAHTYMFGFPSYLEG